MEFVLVCVIGNFLLKKGVPQLSSLQADDSDLEDFIANSEYPDPAPDKDKVNEDLFSKLFRSQYYSEKKPEDDFSFLPKGTSSPGLEFDVEIFTKNKFVDIDLLLEFDLVSLLFALRWIYMNPLKGSVYITLVCGGIVFTQDPVLVSNILNYLKKLNSENS